MTTSFLTHVQNHRNRHAATKPWADVAVLAACVLYVAILWAPVVMP